MLRFTELSRFGDATENIEVCALDGGLQVNNVGTNIRKPAVDFTTEEFSLLMATNFESMFHLCQLAHPLLKASGLGSVVFTSSVSGFVSLKSMSVHGATKGYHGTA